MSKELTAHGSVVGSLRYFQDINSSEVVTEITGNLANYTYYDFIKTLAAKCQSAVEETFRDLDKFPRVLRFVPKQDRDRLLKFILNLDELLRYSGQSCNRTSSCKSLLSLSDSNTRLKSGVRESDIEKAVKIIKNGGKTALGKSDRVSVARKAASSGLKQAVGNDPQKQAYLSELMQGHNTDFLEDVLLAYDYSEMPAKFSSLNYPIGSVSYVENMEKRVFIRPNKLSFSRNSKSYTELMKIGLQNIANKIDDDLNTGIRNNDYIQDQNAGILRKAIGQLEKCGVRCGGMVGKIEKLAWFVGGDPNKIKELQRKLNALGIQGASGKLLEDGVYGKETLAAWNSFYNKLVDGTVPTLNWIDPLQTNITNIGVGSGRYGVNNALVNIKDLRPNAPQYLRIDPPHKSLGKFRGNKIPIDYNHINVFDKPTNALQGRANYWFNHHPLSDRAYNFLKNFDGVAKKVNFAGRILLVEGIVLDALELGMTIDADLKDADKKLGKKTVSTVARIGGRWAGAIGGAKLGAMGGAAIGTAIFPGPGTAIGGVAGSLILGIAGAFGGDALTEWIVDVTYAEE